MARSLHKLTDTKVRALGKGRHSDGGGLYLRVSTSGGKSWSFMFNRNSRRAKVKGWRSGENPAIWKGNLDAILPQRQKLSRGHMAAIPYGEMPDFVGALRELNSVSALTLEFLILTASRSGEVLGARWDEIDLEQRVWTVPAERMKARREHRVPLTNRCLEILAEFGANKLSGFVFPGSRAGREQSNMTMTKLLRRMGRKETVHGMRSAFRDWAGDQTTFARKVAEATLAHAVGNATEQAYRRSDALEKRRDLLTHWERYLERENLSNVINLSQEGAI